MIAFFRKLLLRRRLEHEMQEELAFHIQARADDLARSGISSGEAVRRARIEFGGAEQYKEQLRDTRHFGWVEDLVRDVAYACRNLRRAPVFTLSAAGAIALGIGVNTALFSLAYSVLFRPLPIADPSSVRNIYVGTSGEGGRQVYESIYFVSFPEYLYLRNHSRTADLAGISEANLAAPFAPAGLHAQLVTDNLLPMIGARPARGRFFAREEARTPGSANVVVLSYEAWQKYFNGEDVIGRGIVLNRTAFTVIGVAAEGFHGPLIMKADLWMPITMQAITRAGEALINQANTSWIQIMGHRHPGQTDSTVRAELQVLAQQGLADHAPRLRASVIVSPSAFLNYPDMLNQAVPALAILLAAVSLVLLVACANVANMLVARGFNRSRELAIRLSIGADRFRLVRQLLTEHLLLGLLGGAGGLALSQIGIHAVLASMPEMDGSQLRFSPDWSIMGWTLLVALAAGIAFGLPAAFAMLRGDLNRALRGDAFEAGVKHRRFRLQGALIVVQVAVSALLLINAGLLVRAAYTAIHLDPGHATTGVLIAKPNLRDQQYTPPQAARYLHDLSDSIARAPGVTSAAITAFEPLRSFCGSQAAPVLPDGTAKPNVDMSCFETGPDYLRTMRIRLLEGRGFEPADENAPVKVTLVDEIYARKYLAGNPLGRRVRIGGSQGDRVVVGVVSSITPLGFLQSQNPQVYTPIGGTRYLESSLVIAYQGPRAPIADALKAASARLDREISLTIKPIEENVAISLTFVRLAAGAFAALGILALILACTGVYGVVAFTVGRRRREIGIRLALGAEGRVVMRLLIWQSLKPVALGAFLGADLALACSYALRAALYGISPADPLGFGAAILLLIAVATMAALVPASSALRVDPAATLRHD
jgi:putative ABC transport system permease protein